MIKMRKILTAIAGGMALTGSLLLAAPASASSLPAIDAHATGWYTASVRPTYISVGQGGSPEVTTTWSHWNTTSAYATGTLELFWCSGPSSGCVPTKYGAGVSLWRPRWHNGRQWFTRMNFSYHTRAGVHKVRHWSLTSGGFWVQTSITTG
jgi:hypothetical protein